jgi:alpha-L-arabinofuranosidase
MMAHLMNGITRICWLLLLVPGFGPGSVSRGDETQITIDASKIIAPVSPYLTGVCMEDVNHEIYGGIYSQMVFGESFQEPEGTTGSGVSKWWKPVQSGTAQGKYELIHDKPFVGAQSQRITFAGGEGKIGISNAGLNGQGMYRPFGEGFEGELWVRAPKEVRLSIALVGPDGGGSWSTVLTVPAGDWKKVPFSGGSFTAGLTGGHLSFEIALQGPGTVDLGYAFIEPFSPGRFKGQHVRRDVAEKLIEQGVTVMRYGGSMVNDLAYRWKNSTGPRAKRPPTHGTWYPFSSNGWGIPDFCAFTDAADFLGIPAFNSYESPQDMADFLEYAHGDSKTKWGGQRIADGYDAPFKVHVIEIGNEEKVDDDYWKRFEPIARAIWSRDPKMILTVGDFHYDNIITDPFHVTGAAVDSLAAHQKILALAKEYGAEVWFDVHLNTQDAAQTSTIAPLLSFIHALQGLSNGAKFHVVTYELNAYKHDLNRALANARAIGMIERAGAEPVVTSANALQVDGQNDNGWDQGLIFMNPSQVWVQPPGYVMQMISSNRLDNVVQADCNDPGLDVTTTSGSKKELALQVVNWGDIPKLVKITFADKKPRNLVKVLELSGALNAVNTATASEAIKPSEHLVQTPAGGLGTSYTFPPHSFSVLRFQ